MSNPRAIDPNVPKDWLGFEKTFEFFQELRPRLEDATGSRVNFSWFLRMDPMIARTYGSPAWAITRYRNLFEKLEPAGDEFGLHTHAWRWDDASCQWIADMGDQNWVEHCVRMGFEAFEESLNRPCFSFRFGEHWMNNATLDLVEKLGARIDLTAEPGVKTVSFPERFTGSGPDFSLIPRQPYRASMSSFIRRGRWRQRRLWMVPMSTGKLEWILSSLNQDSDGRNSLPRYPKIRSSGSDSGSKSTYDGFLDRADCHVISGWAYDTNRPDDPVDIEIYKDGVLLGTLRADKPRLDLLAAGKGNGRHGFSLATLSWLGEAKSCSICVKVAGSDFELSQSPKIVDFYSPDSVEDYLLLLNADPWLMSRSIGALLDKLEKPYLALPLRSNVILHPDQLSNMKGNLDYILSHSLVTQFVFETPTRFVERLR